MSGDDPKSVEFPEAEVPPEERARRLKVEVERLARQSPAEWMFWLDEFAKKHGIEPAQLKAMIQATIKQREKEAKETKAEDRQREQRAERKQERDGRLSREEQERARKEAERARKEAERIEREQEEQRKKRETVFAEIADLPRMTHAARLKEAASRLGEDPETLIEEFELFFATRSLPAELVPWPDPVDTAEVLAGIETKFRRYVVVSDSIAVATALWVLFTYLVEIAVYAPKLLFTFPERDAGKSTALHVLRWMVQRPYLAVEATGAAAYKIADRLRCTFLLDEADTLFGRSTVLAHIVNESWTNSGAKIPRVGPRGEVMEFDVYGTQAISMKGLKMSDTTLSRCIICMIWPKLPSEVVDDFNKRDDEEFVTLRRTPAVWLRSLIKPEPGMAVAYIDYSSMEFMIAAVLSDGHCGPVNTMLDMYLSGDPYLAFAKRVGAMPSWATKTSHADVRDKYKVMLLATQYGMAAETLAGRLGVSTFEAHEMLNQHRELFAQYWVWSDDWVQHALQSGAMSTAFGWTCRTGILELNERSIRNWPIQATGADILRIACILAARHGIKILA